jgi:chemosensory pili system protein ChpA (sensor histidine kinase/response regulator)
VSESFDIGPLTWVKDDINQSLDSVLETVEALNVNPDETSGLRFAQTHLYQASGALDMVGLEGCKLFCTYLEKLASKLEKNELQVTPAIVESFIRAIKTLKYYIQELLNGSSDIPLRLYSVLKPVALAMDETVEESQLFFPDTSFSAPKDIESKEFGDGEYTQFITEQRLQYQKSLLKWMQSKEVDATAGMNQALLNVSTAQHKSNVKTLWWAASAFVETLNLPDIAESLAAKKLCRKLDQELKLLVAGEAKANNSLLKDVLYFVSISDIHNETVLKVKEVFELDGLVDKSSSVLASQTPTDEAENNIVEDLKQALETLREIWEDVSNRLDFEKIDVNDDYALVDLDNVLITKFSDKLTEIQAQSKTLSQTSVVGLFEALLNASVVLRDDKLKATQVALIEVATALHLLDSGLSHYQSLDADTIKHLHAETERLNAVASGHNVEMLAENRSGGLDRDTVVAVVKDINASLKVAEQALDTYFRNPQDKSTLSLTNAPLKQVASIFNMLDLPTPTNIINASEHLIEYFKQDAYQVSEIDFELLAETLSMVGLFANEMPNVRSESTEALEDALNRLNSSLQAHGVSISYEVNASSETTDNYVIDDNSPDKPTVTMHEVDENTVNHADGLVDKAFDAELLDIYLTEAEEVIAHIAQNLQALRVSGEDEEALIEVRRNYHTLKGSGRTVGLVVQAEVAAKVEQFLNGVLDKKATLDQVQIKTLEEITAEFAQWAAELRSDNEAKINQQYWLTKVASLAGTQAKSLEENNAKEKVHSKVEPESRSEGEVKTSSEPEIAPELDPFVYISGKHQISRQLYDIFLNESMLNLTLLEQDVAKLTEQKTSVPEKKAKHAIHTLASNALAAGFTPMGELCRALESWFDEVLDNWKPEYLPLYSDAIKTVSKMWQSASELKMPRGANALKKLLVEATEKENANKAKNHQQNREVYQVLDDDLSEESTDATIEILQVAEPVELSEDTTVAQEHVASINDQDDRKINRQDVNSELLEMFIEEANQLLPEIGTELRAWKGKPKQKEHSEALQRALHTLKGSARMASQPDIGNIAHELEEFILKVTKDTPKDNDFDAMFIELDKMSAFFDEKEQLVPELLTVRNDLVELSDDDSQHVARTTDRKSQFLRLRADVLDRLINEAGEVSITRSRIDREMVGFKQSSHDLTDSLTRLRGYLRELEIEAETQMQSRMNILQEANESFDPLEFDRFTRLQELTRMIAESVNDVSTIQGALLTNVDQTEAALQQQNRMNRDLQQGLLGVRMLPFKIISERMQRIVRQTARELKKSVDLIIEGETTEIDRSVLDRIGAPLEHLLRNAVAHGIESKTLRKLDGKNETGIIRINIKTVNDEIHIDVKDDGAGVNLKKVKQRAIENQLITDNQEVTEDTLLSVIFEPGFSTADDVTQIAGRGVGLDVVRNDISSLGGRIDMSSEAGKGSTFNIYLPVTQSVANVLVIRAGDESYAIPVAMIEQAQKIKRNDLVSAYAEGKIKWGDAVYPLHHLAKLLDHQEHQIEDTPYASILLLRSGAHTVALHVDDVVGNQEVVMKNIGSQLARVPGIVGATVTGDGRIILMINPVQIANREVLAVGGVRVKNVKAKVKKVANKTTALVVDDSLTMRKVLGRLLERERYEVLVAKDGMDAIEILQNVVPDIILTDIEMPRMDGFGLARNIRDDERFNNTPLIMISSRTADKHQNLAKEIGVNAFFGKPVQDDDLLEKMKELLKKK